MEYDDVRSSRAMDSVNNDGPLQVLRLVMLAAMLLLPLATMSANAARQDGDMIDRVEAKRTWPF